MSDSWLTLLSGSFQRAPWGWGVFALLVGGYFKLKPVLTELANKREANLLNERAEEMASMRDEMKALKAELAAVTVRLTLAEEETRQVRHDLANTDMVFDHFIEKVRSNPNEPLAAAAAESAAAERQMARERSDKQRERLATVRAAALAKQVSQ